MKNKFEENWFEPELQAKQNWIWMANTVSAIKKCSSLITTISSVVITQFNICRIVTIPVITQFNICRIVTLPITLVFNLRTEKLSNINFVSRSSRCYEPPTCWTCQLSTAFWIGPSFWRSPKFWKWSIQHLYLDALYHLHDRRNL